MDTYVSQAKEMPKNRIRLISVNHIENIFPDIASDLMHTFQVLSDIALIAESSLTHSARKWFFSSVNSHVFFQVRWAVTRYPTQRAKRFLFMPESHASILDT